MKTAKLKILGIETPIREMDYFEDHGFVESIKELEKKIFKMYGFEWYREKNDDCEGVCITQSKINGIDVHIGYKNQKNFPMNIRIRSHEETHALEKLTLKDTCPLNGLDLLAEKILMQDRAKINFKEIDEAEVRANIGSIYALYRHEINPEAFSYPPKGFFSIAKKIYLQSRMHHKSIFTP